jgi:benzodiazapine receptor
MVATRRPGLTRTPEWLNNFVTAWTEMVPRWVHWSTLGCVLLANAALGSRIGDRSRRFDTALNPASAAFSIWGAIYSLLTVAVLDDCPATRRQLGVWYPVSSLFSIAWLALFTHGNLDRPGGGVRWAAAALLLAAAVSAVPLVRPGLPPCDAWGWVARVGLSLYAGWLVVAASIGVAMAASVGATAPRWWRGAAWAALLLLTGGGGLALRDPSLVVPVAWAALWRATRGDGVAAVASGIGVAMAVAAGVALAKI